MKFLRDKTGFTLIEILVVTSILSLLSSVVITSTNSAREKANIAAGKKFDTYNYHAFGVNALGIYSFDSGIETLDHSTYANNLTFTPAVAFGCVIPTNTNGINGNALSFISSSNCAESLNTFKASDNSWTISVWVKPISTNNISGAMIISDGQSYLTVARTSANDSTKFSFLLSAYNPLPNRSLNIYESTIRSFGDNKWYHVAGTYKYDPVTTKANTALYVNGIKVASGNAVLPSPSILGGSGKKLLVGNHTRQSPTYEFVGHIDEVKIYSNALLTSEVQKIYAKGLPKHLADIK